MKAYWPKPWILAARSMNGLCASSEIGGLTGLQTLDLYGCSGLRELPAEIGGLTGLKTLDLEGCSGLRELPAGLGGLSGPSSNPRNCLG